MKQFFTNNVYKILLGVLAVVFTVLAVFGMGNLKAPSSYYAFGEMSGSGKNSVAYQLTLTQDNKTYTLDSVWINIGSHFNSKTDSELKESAIICGLAATEWVSFNEAKSFKLDKFHDNLKIGGWQQLMSSSDVGTRNENKFFLMSIDNDVRIKINEIAFVGKAEGNEDLVLLKATAYASGLRLNVKDNLHDSVNESTFDNRADAKARANALIDEQDKFDTTLISSGYYKNDAKTLFSEAEADMLESIRNITTGRDAYVSATVHPLGLYVMALGTTIFGATTVGIRLMPMLFAVGTLILLFALGKLMFGKEAYGLLTAFLYAIGGFALSLATVGVISTIYIFFVLLSFYGALKFYRKGVSNTNKTKGYLNVLMAGSAFGVAVAMKTQSIYFLPAIIAIMVFGFIRQQDAQKARKTKLVEGSEAYKNNELVYKNKRMVCLCLTAIGFIVVPLVLYAITYLASYSTYAGIYSATNVFAYAAQNFAASFTATLNVTNKTNLLGGVGGWALSYKIEKVMANKYVFGNIITSFIGIFSLLYAAFYSIVSVIEGKKNGGIPAERKLCVVMPYLFSAIAFIGSWLLSFIGAESGISGYYGSSVFMTFIIVALIRAFETEEYKPLFKVGKINITASWIITAAIVLALTVTFALAVPAYLGLPVPNTNIYMWHALSR